MPKWFEFSGERALYLYSHTFPYVVVPGVKTPAKMDLRSQLGQPVKSAQVFHPVPTRVEPFRHQMTDLQCHISVTVVGSISCSMWCLNAQDQELIKSIILQLLQASCKQIVATDRYKTHLWSGCFLILSEWLAHRGSRTRNCGAIFPPTRTEHSNHWATREFWTQQLSNFCN